MCQLPKSIIFIIICSLLMNLLTNIKRKNKFLYNKSKYANNLVDARYVIVPGLILFYGKNYV